MIAPFFPLARELHFASSTSPRFRLRPFSEVDGCMQTFRCRCGSRLFFENTQCVSCGSEVGWCEACHRMTSLSGQGDGAYRCGHDDCGRSLRKCHNYSVENVCNRCFELLADSAD